MTPIVEITALGNAGFAVSFDQRRLLIDPYIVELPDVPLSQPESLHTDDLILITHSHWDHLTVGAVEVAAQRGVKVVGPEPVQRKLGRRLPPDALTVLEPATTGARAAARFGEVEVTAFRTLHGQGHNSYLVTFPGFRLFHDGDNEHSECLDRAALQGLDALMICPWQGSGWVEFIEALNPGCWLLMHVTPEELAAHERGQFFPDLCDHVPLPDRLLALWPGQTVTRPRQP